MKRLCTTSQSPRLPAMETTMQPAQEKTGASNFRSRDICCHGRAWCSQRELHPVQCVKKMCGFGFSKKNWVYPLVIVYRTIWNIAIFSRYINELNCHVHILIYKSYDSDRSISVDQSQSSQGAEGFLAMEML